MKAMAISGFKTAPSANNLPSPQPGDGEVIVDVEHASLNGIDLATWLGYIDGMMPYEFPITLGRDFSGTVAAVGSSVTGLAVGDDVFGVQLAMPLHHGTFAEQVTVPAMSVARRPKGLDPRTAGALGLAGVAAKLAIDSLAPTSGDAVLISGASGGVGSLAIQLAKARGATVIGTATPDDAGFVRKLGADQTVDYSGDLAAAVRNLRPNGVDAALHAAGDPMAIADLVTPGGRFASVLGVGQQQMASRNLTATLVMAIPTTDILTALADAVVKGVLHVPITKTYSLDEVPKALEHFASGKIGKIAIVIR